MWSPFPKGTTGVLRNDYDPQVVYAAHAMANRPHRHEPWRKIALVPLWTMQLGITLATLVLGMYNVVADSVSARTIVFAILPFVQSALIVLEIIVFANQRLEPLTFIATQIVKVGIWVSMVPLTPTLGVYNPNQYLTHPSTWPRNVVGVAILLYAGSLSYGFLVYYRYRRALQEIRDQRYALPQTSIPPLQEVGIHAAGLYNRPARPYISTQELGHPAFSKEKVDLPGKDIHPAAPPYTIVSEQPDDDEKKFGIKRVDTQELTGDSEAYELSTARSLKNSKKSSVYTTRTPDLVSPEESEPPRRF